MKIEIHMTDDRGDICRTLYPTKITFRGRAFVIPRGFESDGASVPRVLWRVVCPPLDPEAVRGSIAHDYIYRTQPEGWTRRDADLMLYCFLVEDGMSPVRAQLAFFGVRIGGWIPWRQNRKRLEGSK